MEKPSKTNADLLAENESLRAELASLRASGCPLFESGKPLSEGFENSCAIVNSVQDAVYIIDTKGVILSLNPAFESITGLKREEWVGQTFGPLVHPDDLSRVAEHFAQAAAGVTASMYEARFVTQSGEYKIGQFTTAPYMQSGKVIAVVGIARDITEFRLAEKSLRESNELLTSFMDSSTDAFTIWDKDLKLVDLNQQATTYLARGVRKGDVLGASLADLLPDAESSEDTKKYQEVIKTGIPYLSDDRVLYIDGKEVVLNVRAFRVGEGVGIMTSEITERKQAENASLEAAKFKDKLISEIPVGISIYDADSGQCVAGNKTLAELIGATEEQILSQNFYKIESWKRSRLLETAKRALEEDAKQELEEHVVSTFGKEIWFYCYFVPFNIGKKKYLLLTLTDLTDKKRAEEERRKLELQVQHSQKLESLGVLAGGIAHDFNNLLVGVLGNAELALLDLQPESPIRSYVKDIQTSSLRLSELTQQMLAYSGKGINKVEKLNLTIIVEEMVHLLQRSISKKVALKFETPVRPAQIKADASQIRQVIMNLITNAAESYGQESGIVLVSIRLLNLDQTTLSGFLLAEDLPTGNYVLLEVSDTGSGMEEETKERIFDPFFSTKYTGRGLGLSAVLGIVRSHGGAIHVSSESKQGTTIKILFPHEKMEGKESGEASSDEIRSFQGHGMVLLVDDEEEVLRVGKQMLERMGYTVLSAVDGSDAIDQVRKHTSELVCVLLDLTMPKMDGLEAFSKIRSIRPDLPVLLCSGYNQQAANHSSTELDLTGFLHKPFRYQSLVDELQKILE